MPESYEQIKGKLKQITYQELYSAIKDTVMREDDIHLIWLRLKILEADMEGESKYRCQ